MTQPKDGLQRKGIGDLHTLRSTTSIAQASRLAEAMRARLAIARYSDKFYVAYLRDPLGNKLVIFGGRCRIGDGCGEDFASAWTLHRLGRD